LTVDADGNVYVSDSNNHVVRRITSGGLITGFAGTGVAGFSGDGGPAIAASLNFPYGLALDGFSNLYIADSGNHRIRLVGVPASGGGATTQLLAVSRSGSGAGTITSSPGLGNGVACGTVCNEIYPHNASVTLVAAPAGSSQFTGWRGGCSGSGPTITVVMTTDKACEANFSGGAGDGVGVVEFEMGSASVPENSGTMSVKVLRSEGGVGDITVDYSFQEGTAILGQNFSASNGTLAWRDGEVNPKTISILIIDDPIVNDQRRFSINLLNPTGGATLRNAIETVTIVNDDLLPDGVRCPTNGIIDTVCNALGLTLEDLQVTPAGHLANGQLAGTLLNSGWVSNLTLISTGALSGGIVTGQITNEGRMADFDFHGTLITGGRLAGIIRLSTGGVKDVTLESNTVLNGGTLSGLISGQPATPPAVPALVDNTTVMAGSVLSNLRLGANVILPPDVILGVGVQVPPGFVLPPTARLEIMLPLLPAPACAGIEGLTHAQPYNLMTDVYYPSAGIVDTINHIPALLNGGYSLSQHSLGYLMADAGVERYAVQPFAVEFSKVFSTMTLDDTNRVDFYTNDIHVVGQPALQEPCTLLSALKVYHLPELRVESGGNLRIPFDSTGWFYARPALSAAVVPVTTPTGLYAIGSPALPNLGLVYYVFAEANGQRRQQILHPAPVDAQALRQWIPGLQFGPYGTMSVTVGGKLYSGALDYWVDGSSPGTGAMDVGGVGDANNDGVQDYALIYPNGERQILFMAPVL
jgi:hypothetical protein